MEQQNGTPGSAKIELELGIPDVGDSHNCLQPPQRGQNPECSSGVPHPTLAILHLQLASWPGPALALLRSGGESLW
jgi:hypothetical protein